MKKSLKYSLYATALLLIGLAVYCLIPLVNLLLTEEGRVQIDEKIRSYGSLAPLIFICVEIIQIVAAFIPGAPVDILGGVLFGAFQGVIWCFIGVFIGTAIVFCLVRKFGRPLVYKLFPGKKLDSVKLLNNERRLTLAVFILFAIPGTPKDFLTYLAALTKIRPAKFFITASSARLPSIACSVMMGANLGEGRFSVSIIIFAAIVLLSAAGWFINRKFFNYYE